MASAIVIEKAPREYSRGAFLSLLVKAMMNDEEKEQQQFEEYLQRVRKDLIVQKPDPFRQGVLGCFTGCILGPLLLFSALFLQEYFRPHSAVSSPLLFVFVLIFIPISGGIGALLTPFVLRLINRFRQSK